VVKPVVIQELLAIIRNLSRRLRPASHRIAWQLSLVAATLSPPGHAAIPLTAWEVTVLREFAAAPNQQISRDKLIEALGKSPDIYDQRALEAGISRLRKKLPPSPDGTPVLQALRSIGYRFNRPLTF
jgi:two-component system phosphate regulon response regulator OmpR